MNPLSNGWCLVVKNDFTSANSFLEGVAEGAPELLKKEMPTHRHAEKLLAQNGVSKDDPDYHKHLANTIKHLRKFGNIDQINKQGVDIKLKIRCPERSDYDKDDVKKVSGNTEVVTCVKN